MISVVVISYRRPEWLSRCLESLKRASDYCPAVPIQIHVLINGFDPSSVRRAEEWIPRFPPKGLKVDQRLQSLSPAAARNYLIDQQDRTEIDWIYFVDDDAYVPETHWKNFLNLVQKFPQVSVIGGPNLTPPQSNWFQRLSGFSLSLPIGTFVSFRRYRVYGKVRECDETSLILCNLFMKADCFESDRFKEDLVCSEENWLLQSISQQGKKALYDPDLFVWHERRPTWLQFVSQIYKYGYGRGQTIRQRPELTRPFHLIPSAFLICLLFSFWFPILIQIGLFYLGVCLVFGGVIVPLIHASYGLGVLFGLAPRQPRRSP